MTGSAAASVRDAIIHLHRAKDAVYRDAWKKRGEVISILANVARKVDRLEYAIDGAPPIQDETLLDTAVDLLVYCIKYETYLADMDASVAETLFGESELDHPYSQGYRSFEHLLLQLNLPDLDIGSQTLDETICSVLMRFDELQACFVEMSATHPPPARLLRVRALAEAAAWLVLILHGDSQRLVG